MTHVYKLKFDDELQANAAISSAVSGVNPYNYSIKTIGIHREYEYDENDHEAEPIVTVFDGWHVDIVSRVELEFDPSFLVYPKNPIHEFSGVR